ncbi:Homeodomain-like protein [Sarocladium implicatum]|nr:Homeodomain-like protein [Sarocladium implicatum]
MDTDDGQSSQGSQDLDYTVDGGIPDAQFDEAMKFMVDEALRDDLKPEPRGFDSHSEDLQHDAGSEYHDDSDYQDEEEAAGPGEDSDAPGSPTTSELGMPDDGREIHHMSSKPRISSSHKRRKPPIARPFKRKLTEVSAEYLDLLNTEIREAACYGCTEDRDIDEDGIVAYRASQLGLTVWSPIEKRILYEATSRLGRSAVAEISARIGSKSVVEVEDYLSYLHYASEDRKAKLRPILQPAERPSAVELSPQCCNALDQAADTLSILQERKEEKRELTKWGDSWKITQPLPDVDEKAEEEKHPDGHPDFNTLFDISKWLSLSSDVFMNSAVPSSNWNSVHDEAPSIWATAMEDFHSLAVSITRRLVQTTLVIAMSRHRTMRELDPRTVCIVRREDVETALQSLDMEDTRPEFWRGAARRLRLNVLDNETKPRPSRQHEEDEEYYMSYNEVENALEHDFDPKTNSLVANASTQAGDARDKSRMTSEEGITDYEADIESSTPQPTSDRLSAEELAIQDEAEEVILHSGVDFPQSSRSKEVLLNRIAGERRQEEYADHCDMVASRECEVKMWEMLGKPVPPVLRVRETQPPLPRSNLGVEGVYSVGRNWRRALQYHAEWETKDVEVYEGG